MKQITIQSIEASLRENFTNYPESYPINGCSPSEDAISNLLDWIENEHENDQDEDKGTLEEWIEICTNYFIHYFDFKEEEFGENKAYILDQIHFLQLYNRNIMETTAKTYDVVFNDSKDSNNKGMKSSIDECKQYIKMWNGTDHSYFADYKGGIVSVVCNETGEEVYSEEIK